MDRPLLLRCWAALDMALWIPLGTGPTAMATLQGLLDAHDRQVDAREEGQDGQRPVAGRLALVARSVPREARVVLRLIPELGGESQRAQRVAEPVMVFAVLPAFLVATGVALGGAWGALMTIVPFATFCVLLFARVRTGVRRRPPLSAPGDRDAVWTLPNAITACRMVAVCCFPLVLAHGHPEALLFLCTMACTDWADGFVARRYQAESKLGTMLDPAVDRLMIVVVVVSMTVAGLVPGVLAGLVLLREMATIVLGATLFRPTADGVPRARVRTAGRIGFALLNFGLVALLAAPSSPPFAVRAGAYTGLLVAVVLSTYALVRYVADALRSPPKVRR